MKKCEILNDILNGMKNIEYKKFENAMIDYIENCMKVFKTNNESKCVIKCNQVFFGSVSFNGEIIIDEEVIMRLYNGERLMLLVIFHELIHFYQITKIENGTVNDEVINYIKDILLSEFQKSENNKTFGQNRTPYYKLNYELFSMEIDANINSILTIMSYFDNNQIKFTEKETNILNKKLSVLIEKQKNQTRYVGSNILFNDYNLTLGEAFDFAIKYNSNWLNRYPQLRSEYYLDEYSEIKKIEKPQLDEPGIDTIKSIKKTSLKHLFKYHKL